MAKKRIVTRRIDVATQSKPVDNSKNYSENVSKPISVNLSDSSNNSTSNNYKTYKDLTDEELQILLSYEIKVGKIYHRISSFCDFIELKKIYGNCTFPPYVLNSMKLVVEND